MIINKIVIIHKQIIYIYIYVYVYYIYRERDIVDPPGQLCHFPCRGTPGMRCFSTRLCV